ncbi:hypothetical protein OH456_06645 [Vibrio sp. La 4.2.2]|uniref:hypothetical protein n=1 Tax=Vibrio sp. La 4.2.2 TaxID=2998830 RepID=UPI0022CE1DAE|nr:hypothetical protein [Vibrio sp. La 4.2.2]MDA0107813.1 hypothetical protein [Vibrio sp. La 4.2.2]
METKTLLLHQIQRAMLDCDACLDDLFEMMSRAVLKTDAEQIDWHLMNEMGDADVLLLIVLTDVDLRASFNEVVLKKAVNYIHSAECNLRH